MEFLLSAQYHRLALRLVPVLAAAAAASSTFSATLVRLLIEVFSYDSRGAGGSVCSEVAKEARQTAERNICRHHRAERLQP